MPIPEEFRLIFKWFHQDTLRLFLTLEAAATTLVEWNALKQNAKARDFLDGLLDGSNSDGQLEALWESSGAEIGFENGREVRKLLMMVRAKMN